MNYNDLNNPKVVTQIAKDKLGENVKYAVRGNFDADTAATEIVAGEEIQDTLEWGIKFALLKKNSANFENKFVTNLLNGSFQKALVQKIKIAGINHELMYYNSQDFFQGSGGGEVFSYIINFKEKKTYYAHLITENEKKISLYISENIDVPAVKSFFIGKFKRDYPNLALVQKDIELQY